MKDLEPILSPQLYPPRRINVGDLNPQDKPGGLRAGTDEKIKQLAKDFESVLMSQLVGTMKETLGSISEDEEEAGAGQVKDMFWMCLSREVGDKGGLGLWKDLYQFFSDMQKKQNLTAEHAETAEKNLKLNSANSVVSAVRNDTLDENL
jgi:Rod binding domain-containing protein